MVKAVIWDMDGVIIESEPYHIRAEIETLKEQGISLTPEVAKKYFGLRTEDYFRALAARYNSNFPIDKMLERHARILSRYYVQSPLVRNAEETLSALHRKYKQGLATSTKRKLAEIQFKRFSLSQYFDAMVFGDEVSKGKPDPEMFLTACSRLRIKPQEAAIIEDAENGFIAGKKAGMLVIGRKAEHNQNQDFSLADHVITDLKEILQIL